MAAADTIAAIATAPGIGGVGIVRVSGDRVRAIARAIVGRCLEPRVAHYVRFLDDGGEPIDEGLALLFSGPRSYTGEDVLEIHAHGGPVVLSRLLGRCTDLGARLAAPGEFTQRAFLSGKIDLTQAEAVADLIAARTNQAARSAARSLVGEFSRRVQTFQAELTQLRVIVEGAIDFPDEGIDFLREADVAGRLGRLRTTVDEALRAGQAGRVQQEGLCVVLVGPPNTGKSSIINMLCMDEIAIVSPLPGTTRDLVRAPLQVDGVPIEIIDTAGLRLTSDPLEGLGIERTYRAVAGADVLAIVFDASDAVPMDPELLDRLPVGIRRVRIHNKIDLVGGSPGYATDGRDSDVWVSALTGAGREDLRRALLLDGIGQEAGAFSARARHIAALQKCIDCVGRCAGLLGDLELAAEELRGAQEALSSISGEFAADDLLGEIFASFCIGK